MTANEATQMMNKDVCITAHVYEVVELPDGTQFLDVCTPETPDEQCRFTIVSFFDDRDLVGGFHKYRNMNVHVRGSCGRFMEAAMVVSHARSFLAALQSPGRTRDWRGDSTAGSKRLRCSIPTCVPRGAAVASCSLTIACLCRRTESQGSTSYMIPESEISHGAFSLRTTVFVLELGRRNLVFLALRAEYRARRRHRDGRRRSPGMRLLYEWRVPVEADLSGICGSAVVQKRGMSRANPEE